MQVKTVPYQAIYQQHRQILQLPWQEQLLDGLKQRKEGRKKENKTLSVMKYRALLPRQLEHLQHL